jgi:hippurate hydrolase
MNSNISARMVSLRRDLHRQPELSWKEGCTAERIGRELDALGIKYRTGVAGTGLIADIPGPAGRNGLPRVALRADMDALPIDENSGESFSSEVPGVMHACGHDGHMAMVIGAAALLQDSGAPLPVRLIFQPAEELGEGALKMVEDGALEDVDYVFGAHIDLHYPAGKIVAMAGTLNASADNLEVSVRGRQSHAARPHEGVDALVAAADFIGSIQRLVARELDPGSPAVITIGQMEAGVAPNILAGRAQLRGTIRAQTPEVRAALIEGLNRLAESVGSAHRATIECNIIQGTPAVINSEEIAAWLQTAAADIVGAEGLCNLRSPNMGGEDFAVYLQSIPGGFVRLGAQPENWNGSGAHSSGFRFDEAVLPIGAQYFAKICEVVAGAGTGAGATP